MVRSTGVVGLWEEAKENMPKPKDKPFAIPKLLMWEAWRRVAANKGAAGVDGQTFQDIQEYGVVRWLAELANELRTKKYRPAAVRRAWW